MVSGFEEKGVCMYCKHANHVFPDDQWHELKHGAGWHGCDIFGGFRLLKRDCGSFEIGEGATINRQW